MHDAGKAPTEVSRRGVCPLTGQRSLRGYATRALPLEWGVNDDGSDVLRR